MIKHTKVDYLLKRLGKLGRAVGVGGIIETIKKTNLVRHIRREHNQIDLRQIIPPKRDETKVRLQSILADDMHELARQLDLESLPWPSWRALYNKTN